MFAQTSTLALIEDASRELACKGFRADDDQRYLGRECGGGDRLERGGVTYWLDHGDTEIQLANIRDNDLRTGRT